MSRSLKIKNITVLSLIFVLFTAAFFGFLHTEKNVASATSDVALTDGTIVSAEQVGLKQMEGASIFLQSALDYSGIRFESRLKQTSYNAYSSKIAGIGMILMPADLIEDGKEFTLANYGGATGAEDVYVAASDFDFADGEFCLKVAIINLFTANYSRSFAARSYVKLANGSLVYTDFNTDKNARTIHSVAEKAIAAGEPDRGNCLAVYMDGVPNVTESGGKYFLVDKSGRILKGKINKSAAGTTDGAAVTLYITVDVNKFNSVLGRTFKGLIFNGERIKTFYQNLAGSVVTMTFQKSVEKDYYKSGYEKMAAKLKENYSDHVTAKRLTGVSYSVFVNGEEKCRSIVGYSNCEQTKPLQSDSIFRMASMTKPITTVAVMICVERGLLDLNVPISTYFGFNHGGVGEIVDGKIVYKEAAREITLRDVLTHSSGLGSGPVGNAIGASRTSRAATLEGNIQFLNGQCLDFAPGSRAGYSARDAFELAAYAVQTVTGKNYGEFVKEEIFDPLGMKDTCYVLNEEQVGRLVDMVRLDSSGKITKVDFGLRGADAFEVGYTGGSSALFSTLYDYMIFANMLANGGEYNGTRILNKQSVDEISKEQFKMTSAFVWGYGVYVRNVNNATQPLPVGSFGWSGAYGTHFWVDPATKTVAVLMLNRSDAGGSESPYSLEFEKIVQANLPK